MEKLRRVKREQNKQLRVLINFLIRMCHIIINFLKPEIESKDINKIEN